jgi:uncharacterized BrkB/YihY/UPF0761 family membrane protein
VPSRRDRRPDDPDVDSAVDDAESSALRGLVTRGHEATSSARGRAQETLDRHRHRPPVDLALRIYERDRQTAGTVVGSAIAFRLFLFFVPLLLFAVGVASLFSGQVGESDLGQAGITGNLAGEIDRALAQPSSSRWIAIALGLFGMLTTGRTLSKSLTAASCLAWRIPVRTRASVRAVGGTVGLVVGMGLVAALVSRVRQEMGIGVAGVSFVVAVGVYAVAWLVLTLALPRATSDPGSLLPGAVTVALTLAGLQAVSQLYLPGRFDRASEVYGALGVIIVVLGWFFIIGRVIVLSFTLNATVYERFGSVSTVVFGLPLLRALPRRWPRLATFFELDRGT